MRLLQFYKIASVNECFASMQVLPSCKLPPPRPHRHTPTDTLPALLLALVGFMLA